MGKGDHVKCYGVVGGPYYGRILGKGASKDCWIVRIRRQGASWNVEVNEDYIRIIKSKSAITGEQS